MRSLGLLTHKLTFSFLWSPLKFREQMVQICLTKFILAPWTVLPGVAAPLTLPLSYHCTQQYKHSTLACPVHPERLSCFYHSCWDYLQKLLLLEAHKINEQLLALLYFIFWEKVLAMTTSAHLCAGLWDKYFPVECKEITKSNSFHIPTTWNISLTQIKG